MYEAIVYIVGYKLTNENSNSLISVNRKFRGDTKGVIFNAVTAEINNIALNTDINITSINVTFSERLSKIIT